MSKIEIEIPDGKKAEWVNGVLTLVDEEPIEYKFKVGDKVKITIPNDPQYGEIVGLSEHAGEPLYTLKNGDANFGIYERYLELAPQSITEQIKTFEDAYNWCLSNDNSTLSTEYDRLFQCKGTLFSSDMIAYAKLRIITCALNEGWEPTFEEDELRYYCICDTDGEALRVVSATKIGCITPATLYFKSRELAEYAAKQFSDIYADFCGCKKGGEE